MPAKPGLVDPEERTMGARYNLSKNTRAEEECARELESLKERIARAQEVELLKEQIAQLESKLAADATRGGLFGTSTTETIGHSGRRPVTADVDAPTATATVHPSPERRAVVAGRTTASPTTCRSCSFSGCHGECVRPAKSVPTLHAARNTIGRKGKAEEPVGPLAEFLAELNLSTDVLPVLQREAITVLADLPGLSKSDLMAIGIKLGDSNKIVIAIESKGW